MGWKTEFSEDTYNVPSEVEEMVDEGLLDDVSWGNDTSPSFEGSIVNHLQLGCPCPVEFPRIRLWVDAEDADKRELTGDRFTLEICDSDGGFVETLTSADEMGEMLETMRSLLTQGVN